ncbi:unnamed protein product [Brachionus calyciflorus]|uniref:Reverse transcriptase RNase H-like domain-containing protein n=1 Tax=Brachionus calyciflorus TaxID=104777 RepID=A0A813Z055_9BILA|nr:unnamed protein product [Brachionus calyciflorus]
MLKQESQPFSNDHPDVRNRPKSILRYPNMVTETLRTPSPPAALRHNFTFEDSLTRISPLETEQKTDTTNTTLYTSAPITVSTSPNDSWVYKDACFKPGRYSSSMEVDTNVLLSCLDDECMVIFENCTPDHYLSLDELKEQMKKLFGNLEVVNVDSKANFYNRRQLTGEDAKTFDSLRTHLTIPTEEGNKGVLILPNFDEQFRLETDASYESAGAVLSQKYKGSWRPVAYWSKRFTKAQRNYSTSEKELLALVLAIEHFKQYLLGKKFIAVTDHKPLIWLKNLKNPSPKLTRWLCELRTYDFDVEYREGHKNGNADALSRWLLTEENDEVFSEN